MEHDGDFETAARYYKQSIQANSSSADPLCSLALLVTSSSPLEKSDRDHDALLLLERALTAEPSHVASLCAMAGMHETKGDLESAEALYRKAVALSPTGPPPLSVLARFLHETGRGDDGEAVQLYEQVLRLEPRKVRFTLHRQ